MYECWPGRTALLSSPRRLPTAKHTDDTQLSISDHSTPPIPEAHDMASPISVPGNQPNNSIVVNGANMGRRGSQSLSSFGPFSPPGATSVAAAAALGSSPPTATNMNMSASTNGSGFGAGFLGGGLARSISNGKQIGQTPLMSPTMAANDKGARGQGILRRLSLGAGAARVSRDQRHPSLFRLTRNLPCSLISQTLASHPLLYRPLRCLLQQTTRSTIRKPISPRRQTTSIPCRHHRLLPHSHPR
jgi:hypothetical protein